MSNARHCPHAAGSDDHPAGLVGAARDRRQEVHRIKPCDLFGARFEIVYQSFLRLSTLAAPKIKTQFIRDEELKGIGVTTSDRIVTLTGTAPSDAARALAVAISRETEGTHGVVNQVRIRPGSPQ